MRGINRQRRQHRPDFGQVIFLQPAEVGGGQVIHFEDADVMLRQRGF